MDRAEFSFDFGEGASTIYHALLPETLEEFPRSRAALSADSGTLHLIVDAEDVTALRAALNTWLRLIKVACEMVEIRNGLEIKQFINAEGAEDQFKNFALSVLCG